MKPQESIRQQDRKIYGRRFGQISFTIITNIQHAHQELMPDLVKCSHVKYMCLPVILADNVVKSKIQYLPGGEGAQRARGDHIFRRAPANVFKGHGQRALLIQKIVRHHQRKCSRHTKVCQETHGQRYHDTDGDSFLWVLHLFTCQTQAHKMSQCSSKVKTNKGNPRPPNKQTKKKQGLTCSCDAVKSNKSIKARGSSS